MLGDEVGGDRLFEVGNHLLGHRGVRELATLAESITPRYRALIYLLGYRGLRIGEAAALRVGDLNVLRGRLEVSKNLSDVAGQLVEGPPKTDAGIRTLTLPAFLRTILVEHIAEHSDPGDPTAYIFPMAGGGPGRKEGDGGPLRVNNWRRGDFAKALEKMLTTVKDRERSEKLAALTPHDLRDTAATLAFKSGATPKVVSVMLGHANPAVTLKIYTGVLDSMSDETDAALDATFRQAKPAKPTEGAAVLAIAR